MLVVEVLAVFREAYGCIAFLVEGSVVATAQVAIRAENQHRLYGRAPANLRDIPGQLREVSGVVEPMLIDRNGEDKDRCAGFEIAVRARVREAVSCTDGVVMRKWRVASGIQDIGYEGVVVASDADDAVGVGVF